MRIRPEATPFVAAMAIVAPYIGVEVYSNSHEPTVEISALPTTLSTAIRSEESDVVRFDIIYPQKKEIVSGSGVRISNNEYITAGHVVAAKADFSPISACESEVISISEDSFADTGMSRGDNSILTSGVSFLSQRAAVEHNSGETTGLGKIKNTSHTQPAMHDIALAQVSSGEFNEASKFIKIPIAKNSASTGERVFMVNYEPANNGQLRSPQEQDLSVAAIKKGYNLPAIFGGIVLGALSNGYLVVLDGLKSYGHIKDSYARGGASGGAVLSANGDLVGISDNASKAESAYEVSEQTGERIKDLPEGTTVYLTLVQPVSRKDISTLKTRLNGSPKCVKVPYALN